MGRIHCASLVLTYTLFILLLFHVAVSTGADDTVNIAAILDVTTPAGKAANKSLHFALQDVNDGAATGTRLNLTIQESRGFVGNVLEVFRSEVAAILVQEPKFANFLSSVAEEVHVPILSFSGSRGFGTAIESTYLVSTFPSRYGDMNAIAAIAGHFQWKSVVVLYEDDEFWLNGVYQLTEALQEFQQDWGNSRTTISQTLAFSSGSRAEQIRETLVELKNKSCVRAFIVHTSVDVALKMFTIAQELGMMSETYAWVVTDSIASSFDSLSSSSIQTLQGIVGVRSVATSQFTELQKRLGLMFADDDISRIGVQAYTSLKLVASAVSALRSEDVKIGYDRQIPMNDTDFPASMMVLTGGEMLRQKIIDFSESGAATDDLKTLEYEIINVVGKSYNTVGYWRKDTGRLQSARKEEDKVGTIIWPGDNPKNPNGYRQLKIAKIAGKRASNFSEFIGRLSGYTDDTFKAAVDSLPYNLPFLYEEFDKGNSNLSNYDALVNELSHGNRFDGVVGDATILWSRSLNVDFTQPYTQTGLVMMVPLERVRGRTWSFLHPFSAGLWAIAGAFFVFTAFLVWLMEHEDNNEFQGKVNEQIVTSLALSLSAFVFAQREEVKSSLGKGIVATWLFIALILNNSYTAHLTSILTVERLAPTITSMKSLTTSNVKVGYMRTSFAKSYLLEDLNIPEDRLVPVMSPHDYVDKLLSGEVGAIVDESLYIQIVKSLYPCAKLEVVDRGYFDTGGFGFFFRKGSPFLSDITEAVLHVSEQHFMVQSIRNKWFGEATSCPDMETGLQSNNTPITPANLWILFVLTASIYALTALIHIGRKLHRSQQDLRAAAHTQDFSTHIMTMIRSLKTVRAPPPIENEL
ncbi:hypothetical protein SUGI_0802600 [Cryptomeria japonica]|uniref:glutamate receptor 3.4 n=1 Tax=Cryptomeria japonica TaxID=3369 RepID=UPI00241488F2|nr:glutamate receptor 3.4 [Cryptomeria japonica]GLJ39324.1 hypothetical protein SUGI_0802600 [Cryptomeria japonica]